MRPPVFAKDFLLYLIAALTPQLIGFLLLPVFSRYLTTEEYALYSLISMTTGVAVAVFSLQLPSAIFRFYFECDAVKFKVLMFNAMLVLCLVLLCAGLVISLHIDTLAGSLLHIYVPDQAPLFQLGLISAFLGVLGQPGVLILKASRRTGRMLAYTLIAAAANILISLLAVIVLNLGLWGYLVGNVVAALLTLAMYIPTYIRSLHPVLDLTLMRRALGYSIPLIPHSLSGMIFMYSDRFILEKHVSIASLGIYVFSDKIASGFKILINQVSQAFVPYFYEDSAKRSEIASQRAANMSTVSTTLLAAAVGGFSLFAPEIVAFLFGPTYQESWKIIPLLSLAYVFRGYYLFYSLNLFLKKRTRAIAAITFASAAVNIIFNLLFVEEMGIYAAVFATLLAFLLPPIVVCAIDRRSAIHRINLMFDVATVGLLVTVMGLSYYLNLSAFDAPGAVGAWKAGVLFLFLGTLCLKERPRIRLLVAGVV